MEGESSHSEADKLADKPIMQLFQRLINNDTKQSTVLTNKQLTDILQNEFHLETTLLHELELDIYLYVIKKFLKDWPQWDEFDKTVNRLKTQNNYVLLKKTLIVKYHSLKDYLEAMLNAVKPYTKEPIKKADKLLGALNKDDVILEIQCSRSQLNQLVFPQPQTVPATDYKTVFNITQNPPSTISVSKVSIQAILNCSGFYVQLNLKGLAVKRDAVHDLEHVLVNKAIFSQQKAKPLNQNLQAKVEGKTKTLRRKTFEGILEENIKRLLSNKSDEFVSIVLETILADLSYLPDTFLVPGSYRRFMSKYAYVRYLYTQAKDQKDANTYNLQIEETISPRFEFHLILKVDPPSLTGQPNTDHISVGCKPCKRLFVGDDVLERTVQHYIDFHQIVDDSGPNLTCSKCLKEFKMSELMHKRWFHECS